MLTLYLATGLVGGTDTGPVDPIPTRSPTIRRRPRIAGVSVVEPPFDWPVTVAEAKEHCGVRHTEADDRFASLIKSATRHVETRLSRTIAIQKLEYTLDRFRDEIELPRGPVQSVESVRYIDADGAEQTLAASAYTVDRTSYRPWLLRNSNAPWPVTLDGINAVSITYMAGFDPVPEDLIGAILIRIQMLYERGKDPRVAAEQQRSFNDLIEGYWMPGI